MSQNDIRHHMTSLSLSPPQVCHGSDLPAWWHPDIQPEPGYASYTPEENALSNTFQWRVQCNVCCLYRPSRMRVQ